jgi:microcompartment protein CcmK/EutM
MTLGKVIGEFVASHEIDDYKGQKTMVVMPIDPRTGEQTGSMMLAVDNVQAGVGDTVLIMDEGGSARMLLDEPDIFTIRTVIAGIVDEVSVDTE